MEDKEYNVALAALRDSKDQLCSIRDAIRELKAKEKLQRKITASRLKTVNLLSKNQ